MSTFLILTSLVLVVLRKYKQIRARKKSEEPQHLYEQIHDINMATCDVVHIQTNMCYEKPVILMQNPAYSTVK